MADLTEEEVFANDKDPIEALAEIRRAQGVAEEDLPTSDEPDSSADQDDDDTPDGEDELDELEDDAADDAGDDAGDDDAAAAPDTDLPDDEGDEGDDDTGDTPAEAAAKRKFKANGQEFEFSEEEMLAQFEPMFGKAMDYTQKMQAIAPYRKMISALESENITQDQFNLALDALKGNKDALKTLMDTNKIDAYDLNEEAEEGASPYAPTDYGKNEAQLGIEEVSRQISKDPEYKITVDVIDNQWDQTSRKSFAANPQLISGLHADIKTGLYDEVAPVAMKMKVYDGNTKSDIEYYMLAGQQVLESKKQSSANAEKTVAEKNKVAQDADNEFDAASSEAKKKRSASTTRKRGDRKSVTDYLDDDNDENYDAWYKNLMASN